MTQEWLNFLMEVEIARKELYCKNSGAWYRGCSSSKFDLKPRLMRNDKYQIYIERAMYMEYVRFFGAPSKSWNAVINMQHYGTPTRLLDWTESFAVALYFAVYDDSNPIIEPTIWILNPFTLSAKLRKENNKHLMDIYFNPEFDYFECFVNFKEVEKEHGHIITTNTGKKWSFDCPIPFSPPTPELNQRIIAQRGFFTIHGNNWKTSMESENNCSKYLKKLVLPSNAIEDAKEFLELSGTDYLRMYPDFEGFSKLMNEKYNGIRKVNQ